ncbi:MAG: hypothetical protein DRP54_05885 [Spirochaetes bacterium]|nr:MAG: hypothetical protein DRP54_05885 [Spirochaetota bacterium]
MVVEKRRYIRHPLNYPLRTFIRTEDGHKVVESQSENIGEGGLIFISEYPVEIGSELEIELEVEGRIFKVQSRVVRCENAGENRYKIAVSFSSQNEYLKARMMEQVVRIEMFKNRLEKRYNVKCKFADVAKVWIDRYSKFFAGKYSQ